MCSTPYSTQPSSTQERTGHTRQQLLRGKGLVLDHLGFLGSFEKCFERSYSTGAHGEAEGSFDIGLGL